MFICCLNVELLKVCDMYLTFCGIGITNAKLFELSAIEFNRNRVSLPLLIPCLFNLLDYERLQWK